MEWIKTDLSIMPIKSWCLNVEDGALKQSINLANLSVIFKHVALMPDCHLGYILPIGGVVALDAAISPGMVGMDVGCGIGAVKTGIKVETLNTTIIKKILDDLKRCVLIGEGNAHRTERPWAGFTNMQNKLLGVDAAAMSLSKKNLGTIGGGNHFIELQYDTDGFVWLMIHTGSRNLGHCIATSHHNVAVKFCEHYKIKLPAKEIAYLPIESKEGAAYVADMLFAMQYAEENRKIIMKAFKTVITNIVKNVEFIQEINIHHNYAQLETHFGKDVWVHRKGATSAKLGQLGVIPGSMGTASYIVKGLGNPESFESCSHGAGRKMGRVDACKLLNKAECDESMKGIVFAGFKKTKGKRAAMGTMYELDEAPGAYKNIEEVIADETDLIEPIMRLLPLGVLKG